MKAIDKVKLPYPKGLRKFIWNETDFQKRSQYYIIRYVIQLEMYDGKPLKRVFAFNGTKKAHGYKDIRIKEVARYYDHKQYLNAIDCFICGKRVMWDWDDYFMEYKRPWSWEYSWHMYDTAEFFKDNGFIHTGYEEYKESDWWPLDPYEYLTIYLEHPKVELLAKAGLGKWIRYIRNLDTTKKSLAQIFKIRPEAVELLKRKDFGYEELMACRALKTADMFQIKKEVETRDRIATRNRSIQYLTQFNSKELKKILKERKTDRYLTSNFINIHDYVNYLQGLERIGAITDRSQIWPEDFRKAHDKILEEAARRKQEKERQEMMRYEEGIRKNYEKHKKYQYTDAGLVIYPVSTPDELITESVKLSHCVRNYAENVAAGTTEIMLIRTARKPDEPFYTLELKGKTVIQVRGKFNKDPSKKVTKFVESWATKHKLKWNHHQNAIAYI